MLWNKGSYFDLYFYYETKVLRENRRNVLNAEVLKRQRIWGKK